MPLPTPYQMTSPDTAASTSESATLIHSTSLARALRLCRVSATLTMMRLPSGKKNGANDAPVLGGARNAVGYSEQAAAVTLDAALTVRDAEGGREYQLSDAPNATPAQVRVRQGWLKGS